MIGSTLTEEGQNKLCDLHQCNLDVFAWNPTDITGVPRYIAKHRLNIREGCPPVRQKRSQAADRYQAIQEEVEKLINARIMKEVHYHVEKSLPFFKTLKKCTKKSDFHWTEEAEAAFKQMKQLIAELPTLTAPKEKKSSLSTWRQQKKPGPEVNYTSMENLVLALVHANKRLKRYFQAHPIIVVTDQPINQVISKLEVAGRLQKWIIKLEEYAIHYRPRVFVKGQILADFIVEYPKEDDPDNAMEIEEELLEPGVLFTDGSSCADGSGAGLILTNPEGAEFTNGLSFMFEATNNEAEYEALIAELTIAKEMGVKNLQENVDSRLVANQVNGTYIAKETDMIRYLEKVRTPTNGFRVFSIKQFPISENKKADALSKIASTSFTHISKQVLVEELKEKSISELEVLEVVEEEGNTWMTAIYEYLTEETLSAEVNKARAVRRKSQRFAVINGVLCKKSFLGPWLRHEIRSGQSFANRILLAYYVQGCKGTDTGMPRLSVIPVEIGMPTLNTTKVDMVQNNEALGINLDLLEERREHAAIREAKSKAKIEKYYNSKSAAQASSQETSCTIAMMQAVRKKWES
nr:reverse transcriptase domain-containing protein [Tanacetum cinerariifolium]